MLTFVVILTCLMIAVMITDLTRYIIPNWLVALILLLYPVMFYFTPARPDWVIALAIGVGAFAVGFVIFLFRIMGGGDIKLLIVTSIWAGKDALPPFIMLVAILGGVLAILLLAARPFTAYLCSKFAKPPIIPAVLTTDQPIPYGIAIAGAFLVLLWQGKIPGLDI